MSGSSTGFNVVTIVGARVAGTPVYTPSNIPAGKQEPVRAMCNFTVYQNLNDNKPSRFRITAWGKLADVVAKSCAPGKELTLMCEINSYKGKIPVPGLQPGQPVQYITGPEGVPLLIEKVGFTLRRIQFGADSNKQIASEIQIGERPPFWNVEGCKDNIMWKEVCTKRNAIQFMPGMTKFGYAEIKQPNGQIVQTQQPINNYTTQPATSYPQAPQGFTGVTPIQGTPVQQTTPGFTGITQGFTGTTPVPPTIMPPVAQPAVQQPAVQQPVVQQPAVGQQSAGQPATQPATQLSFAM